jgi:hypothetical protein
MVRIRPAQGHKIKDLSARLRGTCTGKRRAMFFIIDPQELKPGLVILRRGDIEHRCW